MAQSCWCERNHRRQQRGRQSDHDGRRRSGGDHHRRAHLASRGRDDQGRRAAGQCTISRNPDFGCGSHTATGVPDLENGRLLVYNSSSAGRRVRLLRDRGGPLDDPGDASELNRVDSMHTCHDIGVILGTANKLACAGGGGARIFSLDAADDASLDRSAADASLRYPGRHDRPLGRVELGRRGARVRPRARRRHAGALPGHQCGGGQDAVLL